LLQKVGKDLWLFCWILLSSVFYFCFVLGVFFESFLWWNKILIMRNINHSAWDLILVENVSGKSQEIWKARLFHLFFRTFFQKLFFYLILKQFDFPSFQFKLEKKKNSKSFFLKVLKYKWEIVISFLVILTKVPGKIYFIYRSKKKVSTDVKKCFNFLRELGENNQENFGKLCKVNQFKFK
jgi:hypothetical protein